jgi:UDP-N-acetylmuramate--alanine ligase
MELGNTRALHFVGIGGIGMSGLAEILLQAGFQVSGSDLQNTPLVERLRQLGARVERGHRASNLQEADVVVFSSAVSPDNPELAAARQRGIPLLPRGELLAELMRSHLGISVAGTHGKTSTTSMIALLLTEARLDPTIVIGARHPLLGSNARLGKGRYFVAEADESDRSFLALRPVYAVVTNIDTDHMDQYRDLADLQDAFLQHMNRIPFYGKVIACLDDPNLREPVKKLHRPVLTYGTDAQSDILARDLELRGTGSAYYCYAGGRPLGRIELSVPGRHNVLNSLAAVATAQLLEIPFETVQRALEAFRGAERRMQRKGERDGVLVMDDYGHHPTEIRATLAACRLFGRRLVVVYQPHRYSRTKALFAETGSCFQEADLLFLMDIYPAGEEPASGVNSEKLAELIGIHQPVQYVSGRGRLVELLQAETRPGDLLLTLGAGDVWKIGEEFLEQNNKP